MNITINILKLWPLKIITEIILKLDKSSFDNAVMHLKMQIEWQTV